MKTNRYIVSFSVFLLLFFSVIVGNVAAQNSYPNYLGGDSSDANLLDDSPAIVINDPLEPMNRAFFQFNDKLYFWVLKPVTHGYMWVLPFDLRKAIGNFFLNLAMPVRLLNSLLQGDMEKTGVVLKRFLINSTLGVYGFADIAEVEFGIGRKYADFGQTLGKWGAGGGIYFCWPVVGPSNARDSVGLVVDALSHPVQYFYEDRVLDASYYATNRINSLSLHPNAYDDLIKYSLDPYVASRQAYYAYRKSLIDNK